MRFHHGGGDYKGLDRTRTLLSIGGNLLVVDYNLIDIIVEVD
jgi:hypothetical protein